ncbi:hypothetical protein ACU4GD_45805 [Cupriavidus basilensis]
MDDPLLTADTWNPEAEAAAQATGATLVLNGIDTAAIMALPWTIDRLEFNYRGAWLSFLLAYSIQFTGPRSICLRTRGSSATGMPLRQEVACSLLTCQAGSIFLETRFAAQRHGRAAPRPRRCHGIETRHIEKMVWTADYLLVRAGRPAPPDQGCPAGGDDTATRTVPPPLNSCAASTTPPQRKLLRGHLLASTAFPRTS